MVSLISFTGQILIIKRHRHMNAQQEVTLDFILNKK